MVAKDRSHGFVHVGSGGSAGSAMARRLGRGPWQPPAPPPACLFSDLSRTLERDDRRRLNPLAASDTGRWGGRAGEVGDDRLVVRGRDPKVLWEGTPCAPLRQGVATGSGSDRGTLLSYARIGLWRLHTLDWDQLARTQARRTERSPPVDKAGAFLGDQVAVDLLHDVKAHTDYDQKPRAPEK